MVSKGTRLAVLAVGTILGGGSPALAADLYVPPPAEIVAPQYYTGCYVGAEITDTLGATRLQSDAPLSDYSTNPTGPGVGVRGGCDLAPDSTSPLRIGIVGDVAVTNARYSGTNEAGNVGIDTSIPVEGSLNARLGIVADRALLYVLGGLAAAQVDAEIVPGQSATVSNTHVGWDVGVGGEYMLTDNLSIFGEYVYADLGHQDYTYPPPFSFGTTSTLGLGLVSHTVKAGLNFHF